jgi:hypothetical protein
VTRGWIVAIAESGYLTVYSESLSAAISDLLFG